MKKLLVLALVMMAATAFAQIDPDPDGIGWYWDVNGDSNYLASATPYSAINAYLVATRLSDATGISGWEAEVAITPAPVVPATYTVNSGVNLLAAPLFMVGNTQVLPFAPAIKLLTATLVNFGTPFTLEIGPCTPSSFGRYPWENLPIGPGYASGNDPGILRRFIPSSDQPAARPYFYTVGSFMTLAPIAVENDSWGSVKSLYQ